MTKLQRLKERATAIASKVYPATLVALVSLVVVGTFVLLIAFIVPRATPFDAILWGGAIIVWCIGGRFLAKTLNDWWYLLFARKKV